MAQQTNLNVPPYFDDFNADNDYYKVLFKPGYPVQARELTTLQSILQNQIEKFGQHFFKEGAKVIPGNTAYNALYYAIELQNNYAGVPVSAYASQLVGVKISGETSGVTAVVEKVLLPTDSERNNLTLYVSYLGSNTQNNSTQQFSDGENLLTGVAISSGLLGNTSIAVNSPFAVTIANNASSTGSAFSITEGVYFIRGQFVNVNSETLILDQYTNTPNYRIGLYIDEQIVTSDQDESLQDNSQGFNNYASPGADRLKISVSLFKKPLDDFNDNNFVELATVVNGALRSKKTTSAYNNLTDELARRTYAESGDYYVSPFDITVQESLNDRVGNRGIFNEGQFTYSGSTPSPDLAIYQVSQGKAFVRGYEVETIGATFLDSPKPRNIKTIEDQGIDYNTGPTFKLNSVNGSPTIGFGNDYVVSLRSERVGSSTTISPGKEIGLARVYDFKLTSGSYNTSNKDLNEWGLSLFDIQTITEITVNEPITLQTPTFIKGANSGATGFLKDSVSAGVALTIYDKSGDFITNESFIIDGIENNRVAVAITNYSLSDVKSLYGTVSGLSTFSANVIQSTGFNVGLATISARKYFANIEILRTNITSTASVGSTVIFVDNTSGVSIGSSITVGTAITNAYVVGVGATSITIGVGATAGVTTAVTNLKANVGLGSTTIFLNQIPIGLTTNGYISVGAGLTDVPIVSIGDTFVNIGTASTSGARLIVLTDSFVSAGSTSIFISNTTGVSVGSSIIVGTALTNVSVTSVGTTFISIGAGSTVNYSIPVGTAVTFTNLSNMIVGTAVTFKNVSTIVTDDTVSFTNPLFTSTVISPNKLFPGTSVKNNNIISYTDPILTDPFYGKVVSVGSTSIEIVGVTTVTGICNGKLPSAVTSVSDLKVLTTKLDTSTDSTLYTPLPKFNISNVNLTNAVLSIRKTYTVNIVSGELSSLVEADTNETFLPYADTRYTLVRSDGTVENLSANKFVFFAGSTQLQIYGLGSNDTGATLVTTLRKIKPKAKTKLKNRVNSIIVDKSNLSGSGIGGTTLNDGLEFGNYPYGTRVQDEQISLINADIVEIHGIFESLDTTDPSCPTAILSAVSGSTGTTADLVLGERFVGQNSGAVAIVAERVTNTQISFIYKNQTRFLEGETIVCEESDTQAVLTTLDSPSSDISSNYTFFTGQKSTHYDYGYLKRKSDSSQPAKKIIVYFSNGYYNSSDDGDITTVNSYSSFDYAKEIKTINNRRNSDIIDIRPYVSTYTVSEGSRSPLEFYGRSFDQSGNSATNILASDETILTSFSFYLGRVDRIFITKKGIFQIKYGTPAEKPQKPTEIEESLEVATITLPPYLYNTSDASIEFLEHKRYRMSDIKQLENRIKNLEYYTALSLLETNTAALFIPDNDGLNRFKSGFFVDNFTSFQSQEDGIVFKNSLDRSNKEIRPTHYTTSIDLIPGPVVNADATADLSTEPIEGVNIRKTGDIVTLDYSEVEWLKQKFATRSESVTPFLVSFWKGSLDLTPASDTWVDPVRLDAKIINIEGNYADVLANATKTLNIDPSTGLAPAIWGVWEENWTGKDTSPVTRSNPKTTGGEWRGGGGARAIYDTKTTTTYEEVWNETKQTGTKDRKGTQQTVTEVFDKTSVGDKVISRDIIANMRSRNIQFIGKKVKPSTQLYAWFDGQSVTKYCVPKLLEISMVSGTFEVGETVVGTVTPTGVVSPAILATAAKIKFRVAQSNHREGAYNLPTTTYPENPYVAGTILPQAYSSTSTILNVDTFSLANQSQDFGGWVEQGMVLVGQTSKARATITNLRLVSDISATILGCLFIPDPNNIDHPRFKTGTKVFTLTNSSINDQNAATTIAEQSFVSSGTLETVQENIISIRNAIVDNKTVFESQPIQKILSSELVSSKQVGEPTTERVIVGYYDPLAQSFLVDDQTGIFLTKCEVFFRSKDDGDVPVQFQLRTMENGFPTTKVLPFSEILLNPNQVNVSTDGSVATTFTFKAPVYLEGGKEYAICLASNSTKYSVYICRIGENDLLTQTYISNQPYLGSLFKSQNASTWEASQWEDLKFTLYRADFAQSGLVEFYSPQLTENNKQVPVLMPNSLNLSSRKIRVSLSSTISDSGLIPGNTVSISGAQGTGNYVGGAGKISGALNIINAGIGYTPSVGVQTYYGIPLINVTGNGNGATADVTINAGIVGIASISNGGSGYTVGDVLELDDVGSIPTGTNSRLSVVSIAATNQLILDNVQGNFVVGAGYTVRYTNSNGNTVDLNSGLGGNISISQIQSESDGLHIQVNHKNHGMYFADNLVTISDALPDTKPTKLTVAYSADSTSGLTVESTTGFDIFENVSVGAANRGYLLIGEEIISYTSASGGVIAGTITREVSNTVAKDYPVGTPVYKYELGGVSLNRINKTHNLTDVTVADPITFDSYYIKLNMAESGGGTDRSVESTNFPTLYVNQTKTAGGYNMKATQNIPYEIITPVIQKVTVSGTTLNASIRTVTGTSIDGNEIPYIDNGFENISLNGSNYLETPRLICSRENELEKLADIPGSKSLNMRIALSSSNTKLSPVLDTQRASVILTSNRVNSPITNFATDNRVNSLENDPTAFQYISKEISLENSASSIKIILNAHMNTYTDIRAFYALGENPNFTPIFVPFPGYNNLNTNNEVISPENSDGSPDIFVTPSNILGFDSNQIEFKEYVFTIDKLPEFRNYRIKLTLSSTSQVYVPRIKDLRVITLA